MAREQGTFKFNANLEVTSAKPLDARSLVSTLNELTLTETWLANNKIWLYNHIIVAVGETNGLYMLVNYDLGTAPDAYKTLDNWIRLDVGGVDFSTLEDKIKELENINSSDSIICIDDMSVEPGDDLVADTTDTTKENFIANTEESIAALSATAKPQQYKNICVFGGQTSDALKLHSVETVTLKDVTINKDEANTRNKVELATPEIVVDSVKIADDCANYNFFECDSKTLVKSVMFTNVHVTNPNLTHNILNIYNPADNATITIKDCSFNIQPTTTNPLRLTNYSNSENVTVLFENVDWTYENCSNKDTDFNYAGLVLYQPASTDVAYQKPADVSKIQTWKFIFRNCRYNGELVLSNNMGEHNVAMYCYSIGKTGKVQDPAEFGLNVVFE